MDIKGTEGTSPAQIAAELERGARVVQFGYCVSALVITFRRSANVLVRPGESVGMAGLPYTLLSLAFGWWGFPWGFIYTPMVLAQNLGGGKDITQSLHRSLPHGGAPALPPPGAFVRVQWTDGSVYPAQVVHAQGGQVLLRFENGSQQWAPSRVIVG